MLRTSSHVQRSDTGFATKPHVHPTASQARVNAERSQSFLTLMDDHAIKVRFSPVSGDGVMLADATRNPTNAYKVRGALVSAYLAQQEGQTMMVTASAGNHGAGIAYAAQQMGLSAVVYVPTNAPEAKVQKIREFGAAVVEVGDSFDACLLEARKHEAVVQGVATFVHPFDDELVVAGQGTIGFELLEELQLQMFRTPVSKVRVVLPIGGGGLAAGVLSVLKTYWPNNAAPLEVIGVIDEGSPASLLAMLRGRPVRAHADTIADGTKVEMVGNSFLKVAHLLDGLVLLPHEELVRAMRTHEENEGVQLEGAGALALGAEALIRRLHMLNDPVGTLSVPFITGRNIDRHRFQQEVFAAVPLHITGRQGFDVELQEKPGELLRFLEAVQGYTIASLTYVRAVNSHKARVRVEFEIDHRSQRALSDVVSRVFVGSQRLGAGQHMVYRGGLRNTAAGSESVFSLEDRPDSLLEYVRALTQRDPCGSVDLLLYRKPAKPGGRIQVVMGRAASMGC
jgi:threonine dehydratase